jgi:myosin-1
LDAANIGAKLTTRKMEGKWGGRTEAIAVTLNAVQSANARDAWAKELYSRLFDYLGMDRMSLIHQIVQ